jgi:isocitrate dehydrogenase
MKVKKIRFRRRAASASPVSRRGQSVSCAAIMYALAEKRRSVNIVHEGNIEVPRGRVATGLRSAARFAIG